MTVPFVLPHISIEELEAAESSSDFCTKLSLDSSNRGQLVEFKAENTRCNDTVYGQVLIVDGLVRDFYIERRGCSLSRACIVVFSQHMINLPIDSIISLTDKDWLTTVGTSHPMRNECVLFGIKEIQKALTSLKI